jgi:hypothetical protein
MEPAMSEVPMVALAAVLGATSAVVGGVAIKGLYAWWSAFAKREPKETGAMGTEAVQVPGLEVVVHELKVVVDTVSVTANVNTQSSGAVAAEPTKSYGGQPLLVSPKVQVSNSTERVA